MASKKPSGAKTASPLKALVVAALKGGGKSKPRPVVRPKSGPATSLLTGMGRPKRSGRG
jgi:hypothetical protein